MLLILIFAVCGVTGKFPDWLITDFNTPSTLRKTIDGTLVLSNGLISREFSTDPDFTTIDYYQHEKQSSILRALSPEAIIGLDGVVYAVGFISTNATRAYMNRTALKEDFEYVDNAFHYAGYDTGVPQAYYPYKPMRGAPNDIVWPPKGLRLDVYFAAPESAPATHKGITVCIHYEIYDGIPAMSKWVTISSRQSSWGKVKASVYSVEVLAMNQQWSQVSHWDGPYNTYKWLHVETDEPHGTSVDWIRDPFESLSPGSFQPMVNVSYDTSQVPTPLVLLGKDEFQSFRVHELPHGSSDETREALARHRLLRMLAPHIQENPIFFHLTNYNKDGVFEAAVDQLSEVGFEMVIYSFFNGFDLESDNETYINKIKKQVAYANSKGLEVGGYDLIALTRDNIPFDYLTLDKNNKSTGNACMASAWYEHLSDKIFSFLNKTGMTMVETDGPYSGQTCASVSHNHHANYEDSVYMQNLMQGKLFKELRKKNIFVNQPDTYFYQGGNKDGYGYNENQYSLPRWEDLSVSRQSLFDRYYYLPPTAGWMFLPIVPYHGGGDAAMFEPMSQHLKAYNFAFAQYLSSGTAACYRGYRVFDSIETKAAVKKWVSFFKKYRDILTSDVVRVRRPDMQSIDSFMHVNYKLQNRGLAMVFNPTMERQEMMLTLPLYYTGIKKVAAISEQESGFDFYDLDMGWEVEVHVNLPPLEITWFLIRDGDSV